MALSSLWCLGRPEHEGYDHLQESQPNFKGVDDEKKALDDGGNGDEMSQRLSDLRGEISDAKVDWYVIPSEDEHQSEFVGDSDRRREYISGFNGSAGTAVVPSSAIDADALLFVDSRYWIQAEKQVPKQGWKVVRVGNSGGSGSVSVEKGWTEWLSSGVTEGSRVGIDPKLISLGVVRSIESRLADEVSSTRLIPLPSNLVDKIHKPSPRPDAPLYDYPLSIAGKTTYCKLAELRSVLSAKVREGQEWIYILPALPSIAWLLNYRCDGDVDECPVAYAYAVITPSSCVLFVAKSKVEDEGLRQRLEEDGVELRPYGVDEIEKLIKEATTNKSNGTMKLWAPKECSWAIQKSCGSTKSGGSDITIIPCPVEEAKAIKNEAEIQGMRNAYMRDGRATVRFLSFLNEKLLKEKRPVGEWAAGQILTRYRRQEDKFKYVVAEADIDDEHLTNGQDVGWRDIGIRSECRYAASPHYMPERGKDSLIDVDAPYLFDTGVQYLDGTIDTTRTVYFGSSPSPAIKRAYTQVLQAHIAIATSVFPEGTSADWLNMLAKRPLFEDGLDFQHGLGHGVGCFLSVHEYPVSFPHGYSFKPGVVTTVEPGYYKEGDFGVRTESLFVCKEVEMENKTDGRRWLGWERLTQVPIQTSLVDWSLMYKWEIKWLNDHNSSVQDAVMPQLNEDQDAAARDWLKNACKPKKIWPWTGKE